MKVKFLKELHSFIGHYLEGQVHTLDHDTSIVKNWIENGYCELVKTKATKKSGDES